MSAVHQAWPSVSGGRRDFFAICGNSSHYATILIVPGKSEKEIGLEGKKKDCESGRRRLFQMKELNFKHTWKQICHNRIKLSRNGNEIVGSAIKVFEHGSILISREENLLKIITVECVIGIVWKAVIVILRQFSHCCPVFSEVEHEIHEWQMQGGSWNF